MKFLADTKMADSKRELEMQKASFNQEVNTKVFSWGRTDYPKKSPTWEKSLTKTSHLLRKQRLSWRMSCRRPKSSRRFVWRRLKSRWCRGRSRSLLRRRRSSALTRSSSPLWRDLQRLKPTRCSSWQRDRSESPGHGIIGRFSPVYLLFHSFIRRNYAATTSIV